MKHVACCRRQVNGCVAPCAMPVPAAFWPLLGACLWQHIHGNLLQRNNALRKL
jgi:hypothetical protein